MNIKCLQCGKDREIKSVPKHRSLSDYLRDRPLCIACGHKKRIITLGGHAPNWKGGVRFVDAKGYVRIWDDGQKRYIKEHHKVWIEFYGKIPKGYIIHHKDGNKENNNINNLECMLKKEHDKLNKSLLQNHYNRTTKTTEKLCVV
jgi:hypothetical protein